MSQISDTAFLVNWSKAQNPELSKDPWAHLWVTEKSAHFAKEFTAKVSSGHPLVPALRNRFFVEAIQALEQKVGQFAFMNMGADFTSYPYLIGVKNPIYEIDLSHVISYKKEKLQEFEETGKIPRRPIDFISLDLNDSDAPTQIRDLIKQQKDQPCFILMEGILYYLKKTAVDALFSLLNNELPPRSQVGFVIWPPEIQNVPTMRALARYFEIELGFPKQQYTWLSKEWVKNWGNLHCLEQTDYVSLEKKYGHEPYRLSFENIVNESVFLMEV